MKKLLLLPLLALLAILSTPSAAIAAKPVKNVIFMIPDGTSLPVVALSRWYQWYIEGGEERLAADPFFCGLVKTHSSNAPIGDSAPTTSAYMTGYYSVTGFVSTYPRHDPENDIYPTDPERQYQPLTTLAEAARIVNGKSAGVVVTCNFPHATPADVTAHNFNRNDYAALARVMAYNGVDVVMGGGTSFLKAQEKAHLESLGTTIVADDINAMRNYKGSKLWALFGKEHMPYDFDRDTTKIPSLAEMTRKSIEILSKNKKGFFLMVEGSKVDFAAHANDPVGIVTEFLAFDRAVKEAIDFAKRDGQTLVVVVPDHGNSGISIGARHLGSYDKAPLSKIMDPFKNFRITAYGMSELIKANPADSIRPFFKQHLGIDLKRGEYEDVLKASDFAGSPMPKELKSGTNLERTVANIINSKTYIGFTTNGHTGEDVFLAVYHPRGDVPQGLLSSPELNRYVGAQMGFTGKTLDDLTDRNFAPHTKVFSGMECIIENPRKTDARLIVKGGKGTLVVPAYMNKAYLNGHEHTLETVAIYSSANETFYIPANLGKLVK